MTNPVMYYAVHGEPMHDEFYVAGPRTFVRINDARGNLVAYIGGDSERQAHERAKLFVDLLKLTHVQEGPTCNRPLGHGGVCTADPTHLLDLNGQRRCAQAVPPPLLNYQGKP